MKLKSIIVILLLMLSGLQTAWAQKIILHMPNNQKVEYELSQLDSITFDKGVYLTCPNDKHPHAIDLGLPSGTKWACCNVGASKPEESGGYYAWGETSEKSVYNWDTYAYYNEDTGILNIGSDIAGTDYDAATVNMGKPWRMPSLEQHQEIMNNCSHQWMRQNGVNGILVTGQNGGQIFLPATGYRWDADLCAPGLYNDSDYWSSSFYPNNDYLAYDMYFHSGVWYYTYWGIRSSGQSVRAVCP